MNPSGSTSRRLKIRYSSPRITLTSKLIDGTFPDYTRVIPTANDKRLTAELAEMLTASDRVSTIASDRGRAVKIELGDGPMKLSVNNPDAARRSRRSRPTMTAGRSRSDSMPATCTTSLARSTATRC